MRISDWSSDVCSSDLTAHAVTERHVHIRMPAHMTIKRLHHLRTTSLGLMATAHTVQSRSIELLDGKADAERDQPFDRRCGIVAEATNKPWVKIELVEDHVIKIGRAHV